MGKFMLGEKWQAALVATVAVAGGAACEAGEAAGPWPADVKGWVAPAAGEHPRLFFRRSDLPQLKARAATPEGRALIQRLRQTLNGSDGESLPTVFNGLGKAYGGKTELPLGAYSMSHAAGYGLLYQLTGDRKYAELGRQCFEKAFEGARDRDPEGRYSFKTPGGALRAGPTLGWYAVGYDLCYDGWDEATRLKVAQAIQNYNEGQWMSLPELARGARQFPGCNHWGMQIGGAALALLAIMDDPGVDMAKLAPLLDQNAKAMIRNVTEGFGDGGFFAEGDGTGSMSSHIAYLSGIQAWRVAGGRDFVTPRPNVPWTALKWLFLTVPKPGNANLRSDFPERGGYPHNIWARDGLSGGGYFGIGMGVMSAAQQSAALWFYNHHLKDSDQKGGTPFDTPSPYPHYAVMAFINWPLGAQETNPGSVLPHAYRDTKWGFYAWRNRWQDADDVVISILTRPSKGNMGAAGETSLTVRGMGRTQKWGRINRGFTGEFRPAADGSTVLSTGDGSCLAIDFSRASGADAMLVMAGPAVAPEGAIEAGGTRFSFLFLAKGTPPTPRVEGAGVAAGGQAVSWDGARIVLGR